jgi:hypothetical protein
VVLLERTADGGRKILISGGGRCNVLPSVLAPERFVTDSPAHLLRAMLRAWPLPQMVRFFEDEVGVPLALEEESGKLFPRSNRARDVRDGLVRLASQRGVRLQFGTRVENLSPTDRGWRLQTSSGTIEATRVILATGGLSVPATGSDGVGLSVARALGHRVHDTYPALTPLTFEETGGRREETEGRRQEAEGRRQEAEGRRQEAEGRRQEAEGRRQEPEGRRPEAEGRRQEAEGRRQKGGERLHERAPSQGAGLQPSALAGVSLSVRIRASAGGLAREARGGFLFTHRGYSGPAVLDVSHVCVRNPAATLRVAWSTRSAAEWDERLRTGDRQVATLVAHDVPERLALALVREAGVPRDLRTSSLTRGARQALIASLTACGLRWSGHEGYKKAEVTGGGVALDEVDPRTLESRRCPGLFLCGELLDAFGPIGGHNFAWAWATGRAAGLGAARPLTIDG